MVSRNSFINNYLFILVISICASCEKSSNTSNTKEGDWEIDITIDGLRTHYKGNANDFAGILTTQSFAICQWDESDYIISFSVNEATAKTNPSPYKYLEGQSAIMWSGAFAQDPDGKLINDSLATPPYYTTFIFQNPIPELLHLINIKPHIVDHGTPKNTTTGEWGKPAIIEIPAQNVLERTTFKSHTISGKIIAVRGIN